MQNLTQPTLLLKPFAESGTKNTIPNINTDTSNPQLADLTNGFPAIVSLDPDDGGLPPERADFNGLGYLTTTYDYFYQAGGTFTYNATVASAIGGYPLNARLWYTDSAGISMVLRSTIANNSNNFLTNPSVIGEAGENKPWVIENFRGIKTQWDLFDNKWTDYQLSNQSWLRADTFSWNSGSTYSNAYNHLVSDITGITAQTETVGSYTVTYYPATDGHKIVMPSQETAVTNIYNESGVAWYYILDTTNQRFKLPRENPAREELIQILRTKGDGMTLGLTNGTINVGLFNTGSYDTIGTSSSSYGAPAGTGNSTEGIRNNTSIGVTTDSTKSGIISSMTDSTSVYKGNKYLYFYVGQFSSSATEQTAGLNSSLFNDKVDLNLNNMNPSATSKANIVAFSMPDYGSTISGLTTSYTPIKDGYLIVTRTSGYANVTVTNATYGIEIARISCTDSDRSTQTVMIPVVKNEQYQFNGTGTFIPAKGA